MRVRFLADNQCFSVVTRSHAFQFFELPVEVGQIIKAAFIRDLYHVTVILRK